MKKLLLLSFFGAAIIAAASALQPAPVEAYWPEELHINIRGDTCDDICISPPELCCP